MANRARRRPVFGNLRVLIVLILKMVVVQRFMASGVVHRPGPSGFPIFQT
jgi:hypothetical protein